MLSALPPSSLNEKALEAKAWKQDRSAGKKPSAKQQAVEKRKTVRPAAKRPTEQPRGCEDLEDLLRATHERRMEEAATKAAVSVEMAARMDTGVRVNPQLKAALLDTGKTADEGAASECGVIDASDDESAETEWIFAAPEESLPSPAAVTRAAASTPAPPTPGLGELNLVGVPRSPGLGELNLVGAPAAETPPPLTAGLGEFNLVASRATPRSLPSGELGLVGESISAAAAPVDSSTAPASTPTAAAANTPAGEARLVDASAYIPRASSVPPPALRASFVFRFPTKPSPKPSPALAGAGRGGMGDDMGDDAAASLVHALADAKARLSRGASTCRPSPPSDEAPAVAAMPTVAAKADMASAHTDADVGAGTSLTWWRDTWHGKQDDDLSESDGQPSDGQLSPSEAAEPDMADGKPSHDKAVLYGFGFADRLRL